MTRRGLVALVLVALCGVARADDRGATPRATVRELLGLCDSARYDDVVPYLELPRRYVGTSSLLAHRTCDVLGHVGIDPAVLSDTSTGDTDDDLANDREQVGTFQRPGGEMDPLLLSHVAGATPAWKVSRATMVLIDAWYAMLPARWLVARLPQSLQQPALFGLQRWQLFGIPLALLLVIVSGVSLSWVTRKIFGALRGEPQAQHQLARPLGFLWGALVGRVLVASLGLPTELGRDTAHVLNVVVWLATFWSVSAVVEGVRARLARAPWAESNAGSRALLQLATRAVKLVLFIVATIGALSQIGVPVTSLLAGLGVGGLGLALAAQKTVENLFGAFSIGVDQPFREGDTITVDGVTGTVERIGLRSTRLRTAERTVIAIPNGKLADSKTENITARDRFRLAMTLGLSYATTAEQVQKIVDGIGKLLGSHPKVYTDVSVQLSTLSTTSVNIDVSCTFRTNDGAEFLTIKQQILLGLMAIVQDAGASLASPPQRLELVSDGTQTATPIAPKQPE